MSLFHVNPNWGGDIPELEYFAVPTPAEFARQHITYEAIRNMAHAIRDLPTLPTTHWYSAPDSVLADRHFERDCTFAMQFSIGECGSTQAAHSAASCQLVLGHIQARGATARVVRDRLERCLDLRMGEVGPSALYALLRAGLMLSSGARRRLIGAAIADEDRETLDLMLECGQLPPDNWKPRAYEGPSQQALAMRFALDVARLGETSVGKVALTPGL